MRIRDLDELKVGEVLTYLAETDQTYADSKAALESAEILRKRVRSRVFLGCEGTVAERNAEAEVHDDTQAADDVYIQALQKFEGLKAKRERGGIIIDVWRTMAASKRAGMIT